MHPLYSSCIYIHHYVYTYLYCDVYHTGVDIPPGVCITRISSHKTASVIYVTLVLTLSRYGVGFRYKKNRGKAEEPVRCIPVNLRTPVPRAYSGRDRLNTYSIDIDIVARAYVTEPPGREQYSLGASREMSQATRRVGARHTTGKQEQLNAAATARS